MASAASAAMVELARVTERATSGEMAMAAMAAMAALAAPPVINFCSVTVRVPPQSFPSVFYSTKPTSTVER